MKTASTYNFMLLCNNMLFQCKMSIKKLPRDPFPKIAFQSIFTRFPGSVIAPYNVNFHKKVILQTTKIIPVPSALMYTRFDRGCSVDIFFSFKLNGNILNIIVIFNSLRSFNIVCDDSPEVLDVR